MPVWGPLNSPLFRMLILQPQTGPECHLKQILPIQDLLFWGKSGKTGMGTLSTGATYFQGPVLAAHKGRIRDKIRKVPLLLERRKKYAKMLFF